MKYLDDTIIIETENELEMYLKKYNCDNFLALSDVLWFEFGIDVRYVEKK